MITADQLSQILPNAGHNAGVFAGPLDGAMDEFEINTAKRAAAFLAQVGVETRELNALVENLNYKPSAIIATFNNSRVRRFTPAQAEMYGRTAEHSADQQMIANIAYANRMGNGDIDSGDGWRFRGRCALHATGRDMYQRCGDALGLPLVENPELLEEPLAGSRAAGWIWTIDKQLNPLADSGDFREITRKINGGYNGYPERLAIYERAKQVLGA